MLLITVAEPKQGKSTVTANLSIALAEYGKTVVAVDCDMRLPNLHERFHLSNKSGLKNILEGTSDIESELKHPAEGISILTSGPHPANPSQLLGSPHMAKVIEILREQFDFVLLDTPALLAVSDTAAIVQNMELAQNVNAFMLVVRQSHAQRGQVQAASKFLKGFPGKCAGIVINHAGDVAGYYYYRVGKNGRRAKASERVQTQQ